MIKVFGHPMSTCTRKVLTVLAETATPYEMTVVDFAKGEHKQEPHISRQPFGQVPVIDDGGFQLYESRAICRYLSAKAGDKLAPKELRQRALMDQWLSVEQSNFTPAAMKFVYQYTFKVPQEAAALEAATVMIETVYVTLSKALTNASFLGGDTFSIADVGYMPYIDYMQDSPAKASLEKFPQMVAWWKRVSERPSFRKATGRG